MEITYKFTSRAYNTSEEECGCSLPECKKHEIAYFMEPLQHPNLMDKSRLILTFSANVSLSSVGGKNAELTYKPEYKIVTKGPKFNSDTAEKTILLITQNTIGDMNANINKGLGRTPGTS